MTWQSCQCHSASVKLTDTTNGGTSASKTRLAPQARELLQDRAGNLPVWIRSPKTGTEFYSGLSRAKLYELAGAGKIRSVSIREAGQVKGTRLFLLQSVLDFIASCADCRPLAGTVEKASVQNA
jgi:hypothetical protein